jgi:hypothetical protein
MMRVADALHHRRPAMALPAKSGCNPIHTGRGKDASTLMSPRGGGVRVITEEGETRWNTS